MSSHIDPTSYFSILETFLSSIVQKERLYFFAISDTEYHKNLLGISCRTKVFYPRRFELTYEVS